MSDIKLSEISSLPPKDSFKKEFNHETRHLIKKIGHLQHKMYAEGKKSILVILQGMDASGKDGVVKTVFSETNPSGIDITAFKKPTEEEMAHDFLWRVHQKVPRKGNIMVFNRSHYEDILIQRVNEWITMSRVEQRMSSINAFENLLQYDSDTVVLKFYLHLSHEKQQKKLQERIDNPEKQWKHNDSDWEESKKWDAYMEAYEYAINASEIPWHIIPADKQWYRNYVVASVVYEALIKLNPQLPTLDGNDPK